MKILGIDTTTKFFCLGVYDGFKIYEYNLELGFLHSEFIVKTIKRVLDSLGLSLRDIDYFACGLGPGSFTGIRVGLATIKGIAWVLNKPIIGISTLDILAKGTGNSNKNIIPAIDAKRSLLYYSIFKQKNGSLKRLKPYKLVNIENFCKEAGDNSIILGDAVDLYRNKISMYIKGAEILDKEYWYPKAGNIIDLALEKVKKRDYASALDIKPIYLYPKECQIKSSKLKVKSYFKFNHEH